MNHRTIAIRPATAADAARISEIYAYYVANSAATFDDAAPTAADFARTIAAVEQTYPFLVATIDGTTEGYAFARSLSSKAAYRWSVELTVYVSPDHRGMGLGTRLYEVLTSLLERQNVQTAYACITHPNAESETMHERLGFESLGLWRQTGCKFGQWRDVVWMQKRLGTLPEPAPELIPLPEIGMEEIMSVCRQHTTI